MKRFIVYFLLTITVSCAVYAQVPAKAVKAAEEISEAIKKGSGSGLEIYIGDVGGSISPKPQTGDNIIPKVGGSDGSRTTIKPEETRGGEGADFLGGIITLNPDLLDIPNPWGNNQPNLRKIVISPGVQFTVRGLDTKKLSVSPTRSLLEQKNIDNKLQKEESSQKWKKKLRERVHDKINKVNRMKTKGGIYMIYGHIIIINDNGEYYTNYAA